MRPWIAASAFLLLAGLAMPATAEDEFHLTIKDHRFQPERLEVPAGVKFKITVSNEDATAEEFESHSLHREKIVPAKGQIPVFLGPLQKGEYKFFGDFHQKTAQGVLVVK